MQQKKLIQTIGFQPKENTTGIFHKKYTDGYIIEVDFEKKTFDFGGKITFGDSQKTIQNIVKPEDWVVLECVNRLLEKGYKPEGIILEKTYPSGHGHSGRLDILVEKDGNAFLMIECKTIGNEYEKELKNIYKKGGQLFTYFQNDRSTDVLMLYASELNDKGTVVYENTIINIEEEYRETTNIKDFFDRWNKLPKQNGIFDDWVKTYGFESKALTPKDLRDIQSDDSSFIFNRFLEILRHNVVSDKPNAFNKIFTLFLCKIYDEKHTPKNQELAFQWFYTPYKYDGIQYPADDHISFQKRLTDLYAKGMKEFLEKEVTDISDADFDKKYGKLDDVTKQEIKETLTKIRLEKNNEFAIKEVFNTDSFEENAIVVKEVVELLQGFKIRYTKKQQYLSDFFELLLTTGLKQESGQFFTPVPIAQFIIKSLPIDKLVKQKLKKGEKNNLLPTIIDYASGSGHFITESMHEVQRVLDNEKPDNYITDTAKKIRNWQDDHFDWALKYVYGIEKDYRLVKVGKVGCYLHGDGLAQIVHSDGLGNFKKTKEYKGLLTKTDSDFPKENKQFDIVISNPPYSVSSFRNNARKYYNDEDFDIYDKLTDNSSEIECLFIERTKQLLKDGGLAGIILPSSILSNTGIYTKAREIILEYFDIVAITELGSNTFMATGTNTVTLFLRRRNNYDVANLKQSVKNVFANKQDITLNGIENAVSNYTNYVWEDCSFKDYVSLLNNSPNETITNNDIYKDYKKKLKYKTETDFFKQVLAREKEKLLYYVLSKPQKTVLIKTGQKNAEKQFLGYEFSNRRGSEGIHPIQRGKEIHECTKLFDENSFTNPEKASTYIYKAFADNSFNETIPESLQQNISYQNLVDMLTFDRADFEKNISLSSKKKVKIESRWDDIKLNEILDVLESGKRPKGGVGEYQVGIPSLGGEHIGINGRTKITKENLKFVPEDYFKKSNQGKLQDKDILICKDGALTGKTAMFYSSDLEYETAMINEHVFLLRTNETIIQEYLFNILLSNKGQELLKSNITGQAQGGLNRTNLLNIKIPLPPKNIQKQIVTEIEALEQREQELNAEIDDLILKKRNYFNSKIKGIVKRLDEICFLKAGKFVKAGDINEQILPDYFPCYGGNGLRGYTKTYTNEGTYSLVGRQGALCGNVHLVSGKFHATEHALVAYPKEQVDNIWLHYKLIYMNLNQYATGTAQPGLSVMNLKPIEIYLPPITEQQKTVTKIEKIEAKIKELQAQLTQIPQKKEAILKKYL